MKEKLRLHALWLQDLAGGVRFSLREANLRDANLRGADLRDANLRGADLRGAIGLIKLMGVEVGNYYWKRFEAGLVNNKFKFRIGLNKLKSNEIFEYD